MNEADRIARERANRQRVEAAAAEAQAQLEEAQRRRESVEEIRAFAPVVLARLAASGYPDVVEVEVFERRLVGRPKKVRKGGWYVCSVTNFYYGDRERFPVYLLSDGRILYYGSAMKPEEILHVQRGSEADAAIVATSLREWAETGTQPNPEGP